MGTILTIGDFSRMTHLSVKTLRHYHQVGLLEPVEVNRGTGYRYYDTDQVPTAQVIRRFRDLGMPVEHVKSVLDAPDVHARNHLIAAHLGRLEAQLGQTQAAIVSLRSLLEQPNLSIAVVHRAVPATTTVAIRETVTVDELESWWSIAFAELDDYLHRLGVENVGPKGGLYANELFLHERGQVVVFVPVDKPLPPDGRAASLVLPEMELAVAVHEGPHTDIDRTYGSLGTYVTQHALSVDGPVRESYLISEFDSPDTATWRTEIGWPIFRTTDR